MRGNLRRITSRIPTLAQGTTSRRYARQTGTRTRRRLNLTFQIIKTGIARTVAIQRRRRTRECANSLCFRLEQRRLTSLQPLGAAYGAFSKAGEEPVHSKILRRYWRRRSVRISRISASLQP